MPGQITTRRQMLQFYPQRRNVLYNTLPQIDRPQPRRDRMAGNGMMTSIGRLRDCPILDYKFAALAHNTIRGAAGCSVLNAELLAVKGYLGEFQPVATAVGD